MIAVLITVLITFLIAQVIATAALILAVREVAKALFREPPANKRKKYSSSRLEMGERVEEMAKEQREEEQDAERKKEDDAQSDNALGLFWNGGPIYPYDTLAGLDENDASFADLQQLPTDIPNYAIPDDDDYPLPDDE
ncbi:hypothetical protein GSI_05400 [Ganoderma sinense ZZ0214-1]|uniref:Uncharacterized protein n=1 Tax=Ganoderma sinense ZZ0214-1 TaxID=1077348 RepID=A0A2G8SFZ0_9APHY|nr:hypothetical protein GSI_05400 [Ganoderma sinense ZZ0214-1]